MIEIREAGARDLPSVLELYGREGLGDPEVLDLPAARAVLGRMRRSPGHRLFVALSGGRVVGTFALMVMQNLAHMGRPSGVVEDVAVRRGWRRRGVGRRMMAFALEECRRAGCYKMALSSASGRRGARRFYEALGFRRHGSSYLVETGGR